MDLIKTRLDQVAEKQVGDEIHRGRAVPQRVQQPDNARIARHGQCYVNNADLLPGDVLGCIGGLAENRADFVGDHPARVPVFEETEHVGAQQRILSQVARETRTEIGQTDDHGSATRDAPLTGMHEQPTGSYLTRPQHDRR